MEKPAVQSKKHIQIGKLLLILIAFILGCGLIASAFYFIDRSGLTNPWRQLPIPENKPVKLIAGSPSAVIAQLPEGELISCPYNEGNACTGGVISPGEHDPASSCPASNNIFWGVTGAPSDRSDCIEIQGIKLEQTYDVIYVLDTEGRIWRWIAIGSTNDGLILPLTCLGGAAAGLIVGLLVCLVVFLIGRFTNTARRSK